jgi:hypothetical protein
MKFSKVIETTDEFFTIIHIFQQMSSGEVIHCWADPTTCCSEYETRDWALMHPEDAGKIMDRLLADGFKEEEI